MHSLFRCAAAAALAVCCAAVPLHQAGSGVAWMAPLANRTLTNVTLPGTHDSGAFYLTRQLAPQDSGGPILDAVIEAAERLGIPVQEFITPWALSGNLSFAQQLRGGIRYLDIRACYVNATWYTFHFETGHTLRDLFGEIAAYLATAPPTEVFVFEVSHAGDPPLAAQQELRAIITATVGRWLFPRGSPHGDLTKATLGDMLRARTPAVLTLTLEAMVRGDQRLWPGGTIINSYANSDNVTTMRRFNEGKVAEYTDAVVAAEGAAPFGSRLYKMSWTLTPQAELIIDSVFPGPRARSLKELAFEGNAHFPPFVAAQRRAGMSLGNIWIVDWFQHATDIARLFPHA